ncbi:hypothetical protein D9M71_188950 [compost metagenome]
MDPHIAFLQLAEPGIALLIISRKTRCIALEARIQPQHAMLQRIGIELRQHTVKRTALSPKAMHLKQQLQQIGQGVVSLERGGAELEAHRPVQRTRLAAVGVDQCRWRDLLRLQQADFDHADIVARLTTEIAQRLLDLFEQRIRLTIGGEHLLQSLHAKQLFIGAAGVDHPIGQEEHPIPERHGKHFGALIEGFRAQHPQRQVPRRQRGALATGNAMQVTVGHSTVPDLHRTTLKTQAQHRGTAEHVHRQDALELGIHFTQGFRQAIALGGHPVEDFGQGHGAHGRRQTVAGEVSQQYVHVAGRGERGQQQVAVEQRIG